MEATAAQWDTAQFFADGLQHNESCYITSRIDALEYRQRQGAIWKAAKEAGVTEVVLAELRARQQA